MIMPKQKPGLSKQDFKTPSNFIGATLKKLNISSFAWDLAADQFNAQSPFGYFDIEQDSLTQDWGHLPTDQEGWLWLNPPFANILPWVAKAWHHSWVNGTKIAMLVPASVGSDWYKNYVDRKAFVLYLNGRLAFIPDKPNWLYPKDCMLILYNGWAVGSNVWNWRT